MKYLFFYTEIADYTLKCAAKHLELNAGDEMHVVHYPVNPEAPFRFKEVPRLFLYDQSSFDVEKLYELVLEVDPDMILCSGWIDKVYLKVAQMFARSVPVALLLDNPWTGNFRQRLLLPFAKKYLGKIFSLAWVPGKPQVAFALKLGFPAERIYEGFYSTDVAFFSQMFAGFREEKSRLMPRRFLSVARYIPEKDLPTLWQAFIDASEQHGGDWELWCAGHGAEFNQRRIHPRIKHLGFVQPSEISALVKDCSVFVLSSLSEPWGMVVHEFAAAGMPLLLSDKVGSGECYLKNNVNGCMFENGSVSDLTAKMLYMMNLEPQKLFEMGEISNSLAMKYDAGKWSQTLSTMQKESNLRKS